WWQHWLPSLLPSVPTFCSFWPMIWVRMCCEILPIDSDRLLVGWGDVSFHRSHHIATPTLDLLASTGVVLNNYYVSPICSPSRAALVPGLHPIRTGMQINVLPAGSPYGLGLNFTTLPQHFKRLGYEAHMVGKWHQGFFKSDYLPTRRGFRSEER